MTYPSKIRLPKGMVFCLFSLWLFRLSQTINLLKSSRTLNVPEIPEKSNEMDEVIAKAAKGDAKTKEEVPEDVIKYMRDNGILIDGMTIDEYMAKYGDHGKLDKGGLQAIKAALDNDANRNTDLMSQGQIIIQKCLRSLTLSLPN